MNNDADKLKQIKEILQTGDYAKSFEVVSLALLVQDEEDRNLSLLDAVRFLIKNENWQKAYGATQMMSESYEKSEALQLIANYLASIGHLEKAFSVFAEAETEAIVESLSEWQQSELLHNIAKSLLRIKAIFRADEVWEKAVTIAQKGEDSPLSQDGFDSSGVLAEIAENFAAEERIEKALDIAKKIKNIVRKERVLRQISSYSQQIKRVA